MACAYNAGGAYVPTIFVVMYATLSEYNPRVSKLKHYYGLNHLHYVTKSTYRRARSYDSERLKNQWAAAADLCLLRSAFPGVIWTLRATGGVEQSHRAN